jgi:hypothetical protein
MRRPAWLALAAVAAAAAAPAAADEKGDRIRLEYHALEGCPDSATFEARVRSVAHARFVDEAQTFIFDVQIDAGRPLTGRLTVRRGDDVEGVREVHADTCAEVIDALVLMVELAIEPAAHSQAAAVATATSEAPLSALPGSVAPVPSPAPPPPDTREPHQPDMARRANVAPDMRGVNPAPRSASASARTYYLGADIAYATAVTPRILGGPSPYLGWRFNREGPIDPGMRLAFVYASSGSVDAAGGAVSFTWVVGRADGCLLSWPPGRAHLLGCARIEGGALAASGALVAGAQTRMRGWLSTGPLLRAEWGPLGSLFLDADVAAMLRVTDDRFFFAPDATVYAVPLVGLEAAAGVGVHFL